jgi:hypothetical protein
VKQILRIAVVIAVVLALSPRTVVKADCWGVDMAAVTFTCDGVDVTVENQCHCTSGDTLGDCTLDGGDPCSFDYSAACSTFGSACAE